MSSPKLVLFLNSTVSSYDIHHAGYKTLEQSQFFAFAISFGIFL